MKGFAGWHASGTGSALLAEESRQVAGALESIFGDEFLQIGTWGAPDLFLPFARTQRRALISSEAGPGVNCISAPDNLAIGSDCIDAVLLPHALETVDDPYGLLREVDRVLRPDGQMILLGFNVIGWWGARHYLSRKRFPAGLQRMLSEHRLRDWLQLLSYRVQPARFYYFDAPLFRPPPARHAPTDTAPPLGHGRRALHRLTHANVFASCYLLVARKEAYTVTPIRPVFRRRPRLVGGLVNPTTRSAA